MKIPATDSLASHGYIQTQLNGSTVVVCDWAFSAVTVALEPGSLHKWAALQPVKEEMRGRGTIYSVSLPSTPPVEVVIRRNRHGGFFHGVTGDLFLPPTRAPLELATALRLADAGVPTPEVIAYVVYPVAIFFARSDVMTRRLPAGADVPAFWQKLPATDREPVLAAIARLLAALVRVGAWHADLNLKNIYIAGAGNDVTAYLLDVDRVTFPGGVDVAERNFSRLTRSVRKWRTRWGLDFDEASLSRLAVLAEENSLCG